MKMACCMWLAAAPPYSSGQERASQPWLASFLRMFISVTWASSLPSTAKESSDAETLELVAAAVSRSGARTNSDRKLYPYRLVRQELAYNPKTPAPVLAELATDEHKKVRAAVADNPSTPIDSLDALIEDANAVVSLYAVANRNRRRYTAVLAFTSERLEGWHPQEPCSSQELLLT